MRISQLSSIYYLLAAINLLVSLDMFVTGRPTLMAALFMVVGVCDIIIARVKEKKELANTTNISNMAN